MSGLIADTTYLQAGSDAAETVVRICFSGRQMRARPRKMRLSNVRAEARGTGDQGEPPAYRPRWRKCQGEPLAGYREKKRGRASSACPSEKMTFSKRMVEDPSLFTFPMIVT